MEATTLRSRKVAGRSNNSTTTKLWILLLISSIFCFTFIIIFHEKKSHKFVTEFASFHESILEESKEEVKQNALTVKEKIDIKKDEQKESIPDKSLHKIAEKIDIQKGEQKEIIFDKSSHKIAGLSCVSYGGPDDDKVMDEMVYWEDIPSDSNYISPFYDASNEKFMTFEPDGGGFNNIRMAMETVIVMAHAMGRTLVLPPEKRMYLIGRGDNKQKFKFTFNDFFHLDSIHTEHDGFNMITMEEFLEREAMNGKLINQNTGNISFPPGNRTNWNGEDLKPLWEYLRNTTHVKNWKPDQCVAAFPSKPGPGDIDKMTEAFNKGRKVKDSLKGPVPVDGPLEDRMRESVGGRRGLCFYDEEMQAASVVHFMCYHKARARLLTHFYRFLFFEDWKQDIWSKRFIRDHIRYRDELMCAAAKIILAVRDRARKNPKQPDSNGQFDSLHIRRGDFQFKKTRIEADEIYKQIKDKLKPGGTLYIATDERKKDFFKILKENYDVCFLDDFKHLIQDINTNYYGMLDQLVSAKGRVFFGTYYSTLSGYIMRMRGYFSVKKKYEGYESGGLRDSYYIYPANYRNVMTEYQPPHGNMWEREFPISWHDIDKGAK